MATVVNPPSGIQWSCKVLDLIISAGDHVNIAIDVDGTVILRVTVRHRRVSLRGDCLRG